MEVDWARDDEDYSKAANWISKVVDIAENNYLRNDVVLNVNVPLMKKILRELKFVN